MELHPLNTLDEAAELLRCSTKTVSRRINGGELGPVMRDRGRLLIPETTLRDYIEAHLSRSDPEPPGPSPKPRPRSEPARRPTHINRRARANAPEGTMAATLRALRAAA